MSSADHEPTTGSEAGDWKVEEGTGWIPIPGFGRINPRRDDVDGGREYFTPMTSAGEYARVAGDTISGGSQTWYYELDKPFYLADYADHCFEVTISLLQGGRYAVKYRPGVWPTRETGAW